MRRPDLPCDPSDIYVGASAAMLRAAAQRRQGPGSSGIAKRHGSCGDETALCGKRRLCSPGLACDPSSGHMLASTARLVAAVQGLQGPGSRPVPLRVAHGPDRPTAVVRLTLRAGTTLTRRRELRAAATTWLRRARVFLFLACASRGWLGSIRRPEVTCAADKARRHRRLPAVTLNTSKPKRPFHLNKPGAPMAPSKQVLCGFVKSLAKFWQSFGKVWRPLLDCRASFVKFATNGHLPFNDGRY